MQNAFKCKNLDPREEENNLLKEVKIHSHSNNWLCLLYFHVIRIRKNANITTITHTPNYFIAFVGTNVGTRTFIPF